MYFNKKNKDLWDAIKMDLSRAFRALSAYVRKKLRPNSLSFQLN